MYELYFSVIISISDEMYCHCKNGCMWNFKKIDSLGVDQNLIIQFYSDKQNRQIDRGSKLNQLINVKKEFIYSNINSHYQSCLDIKQKF